MDNFESKSAKRNKNKINSYLKKRSNVVTTSKNLYIIFPEKFVDKNMSVLGDTCFVLGVVAIMDDDKNYSTSIIPTRVKVQPSEISTVLIDEIPHTVLHIDANSDLISDINLIKDLDVVHDIYELFLIQGKIPWYLDENDIHKVFGNASKYTGSKVSNSLLTFEMLVATIARVESDPKIELRIALNKNQKPKAFYLGLSDVWYMTSSTISKLARASMKLGVVSSVLNKEDEISSLERVIRK